MMEVPKRGVIHDAEGEQAGAGWYLHLFQGVASWATQAGVAISMSQVGTHNSDVAIAHLAHLDVKKVPSTRYSIR